VKSLEKRALAVALKFAAAGFASRYRKALTMFVACHGCRQTKIGVAVKAEDVEPRAARPRVSSLTAGYEPLGRTGEAITPVAIAKVRRVEKNCILYGISNE